MNFVAIDPGVTAGCACAWFEAWGGSCALKAVDFVGPKAARIVANAPPRALLARPEFVIVERPQADGRSIASRPKDLMDLSWCGAAVAYSFGVPVWEIEPRAWKASIPKPVHHGRVWAKLTPAERAVLGYDTADRIHAAVDKGARDRWAKPGAAYYPRSWTGHNILDAVALGVYAREHSEENLCIRS